MMEKLSNATTKEAIAQQLRELIFSRQLDDGQEITQNEVADSLCLSRMPVREAFLVLTEEGLLTRLANRHIAVNGINYDRALVYFRHLIMCDCMAMDYMKTHNDSSDERSWHEALLSSSGDPLIKAVCSSSLKGYTSYFFEKHRSPDRSALLKKISLLIDEGKKAEAALLLQGEYLQMITSVLEVEFAQ